MPRYPAPLLPISVIDTFLQRNAGTAIAWNIIGLIILASVVTRAIQTSPAHST